MKTVIKLQKGETVNGVYLGGLRQKVNKDYKIKDNKLIFVGPPVGKGRDVTLELVREIIT